MTLQRSVVPVSRGADLLAFRDEWNELLDSLPEPSFFRSPDWASAWWESFAGAGARGELASWRDGDGRVRAVAGLVRRSEPLHRRLPVRVPVWMPIGSGPGAADHAGFVVAPEARDDVRRWLDEHRDRSLYLPNVPHDPSTVLPSRSLEVAWPKTLEIALPAQLKHSLVRRLGADLRKAGRNGVEFRALGPGEVPLELVDRFHELHLLRREVKGKRSSLTSAHLDVLRAVGRGSGDGRGLAAITATRDGEVVGTLLGFVTPRAWEYYQVGWDPTLKSLRIGLLLVKLAIEHAESLGAERFDFLRGNGAYKQEFSAVYQSDVTVVRPRGRGHVYRALRIANQRRLAKEAAAAAAGERTDGSDGD